MSKATDALVRLDLELLYQTSRVAYAIDERFHINQWQIAAQMMTLSTMMVVSDMLLNITAHRWIISLLLPIVLGIRAIEIYQFTRISEQYEKDLKAGRSRIHIYWLKYTGPFHRIYTAVLGVYFAFNDFILIGTAHPHASWFVFIVHYLPSLWFLTAAIAYYFAGVPPTPRKRREKKVREWSFGLKPAMAGIK
jgi:hypothetical protein